MNTVLNRRQVLQQSALGFGSLALAGLLSDSARADSTGGTPLAPRAPHFPATAARVVFVFFHGGISHHAYFAPKPQQTALTG
ncbi:MAG: DUF1501 domain-containing protein, partial [Planctomyces sp.]